MVNDMMLQVLGRIGDCALRENTVASLRETQKFLEKQINEKFSHVKFHLQSLDGKIERASQSLSGQIREIKLKTLGKITGALTRLRKSAAHEDFRDAAEGRAGGAGEPGRGGDGAEQRRAAGEGGGRGEAAAHAAERLPGRGGNRVGWGDQTKCGATRRTC